MRKAVLILLAVVGAGVGGWFLLGNTKTKVDTQVQKATVTRGDISAGVAASGKVVSNLDVDIKCRASGEVTKLPFDVSEVVKKGQLLLELDPVDQERNIKLAQTAVAQSKARLAGTMQSLKVIEAEVGTGRKRADAAIHSAQVKSRSAQAKTTRRQQLVKEKLSSAEDLETTQVEAASAGADLETAQVQGDEVQTKQLAVEVQKHEVELAQAQLDADQISLDNAKQQLAYTQVEAPIDGVVAARNIQIGTIISSGITNIGGGTTVMTLSDVSRLFILASVDESDIGQVRLGQLAAITVDAFPKEQFAGNVIRIATTGVNISNVVTFEVKVEVTSANKQLLKPVMTANVQITCDQRKQVLVVSEQAVNRSSSGVTVTLAAKGEAPAAERPVVLGLSDGERVEVLQGLSEGEEVVLRKEVASRWSSQKTTPMGPPH